MKEGCVMSDFTLVSSGIYLPELVYSHELDERLGLSAGTILNTVGVYSRPVLKDLTQVEMAAAAAADALKNAGLELKDIDCIISASATKPQEIPCQACLVKEALKPEKGNRCFCFDIGF
jgi:3-oxoacyl-[acyl-carrier-protein] synthase-3